ncbi:ribonuclease H-like domain-containing protein [Tanacetum coccineum]|uniref:Ribonuclease H-like domain-containing protein n=1 Tax=Tanacetum coccineum TaxID=301880 RepID=A0ABQ5EIG0_9ASTR
MQIANRPAGLSGPATYGSPTGESTGPQVHDSSGCDSSGDLYPVTQPSLTPHALLSVSPTTWHQRLGHPGEEVFRSLVPRPAGLSGPTTYGSPTGESTGPQVHDSSGCDSSGDLYLVTQPSLTPHALLSVSPTTWHQHLRHPREEVIRSLVPRQFISCNRDKSPHVCHACQLGKHVRLLFSSSDSIVSCSFEIVHYDIWTSPIPYGVDCSDSFSLVVKPTTIRIILSLALTRNWPVHQLDVKNAFLNGDLSETVYMYQLPGFVDSCSPHHVCRLHRSLYGLKQIPRAWFQRFAGYALRVGFTSSRCNSSLFIYQHGTEVAYLLIYVDDIVLTTSSTSLLQHIISSLHKEFDMTDLEALNYFLGILVTRDARGMFLS